MRVFPHGLFPLLLALLGACVTGRDSATFQSEPPPPEETQVDAAAYGSDWFTFKKRMKSRPTSEIDFFFKTCTLTNESRHYSKADYFCEYP